MDSFEQRYRVEQAWRLAGNGWLANARDLKLNREVILWRSQVVSDIQEKEELRRLGNAARFNDKRFVHLLDVASVNGELYAVLTRENGGLLADRLQALKWSGREILEHIRDLVPAIREARKERLLDFSLTADNIWIDASGKLMILNYWSEAEAEKRDVRGLSMLLYQLCARSDQTAASVPQYFSVLQDVLTDLPGGSAEEAANWASSAFLPSCNLRQYENGMERLLESHSSPYQAPEMRRKPLPRVQPQEETIPTESEIEEDEKLPSGRTAIEQPETPKKKKGKTSRLLPWLLFGLTFLIIFIIVLGLLTGLRPGKHADDSDKPAASSPAASASVKPSPTAAAGVAATPSPGKSPSPKPQTTAPRASTPTAQPAVQPTAQPAGGTSPSPSPSAAPSGTAPAVSPTAASGGETVSVPDLTKHSQEEAGQIAKQAGLRYQFYLEANEAEKGLVFKQEPAAGATVNQGDTITFWVSKGK